MSRRTILLLMISLLLAACQSAPDQPLPTVARVELERFMGDWYVIAAIPTFLEQDAYNAIESYQLNDDGTVGTIFSFRKGGFDGDLKRYHSVGYIEDGQSNAVWGVQFFWPFKADYRIMHLAPDYSTTVIGRLQRDYVWIMARSPELADSEFQRLATLVAEAGYDSSKLRKVPQRWPQQAAQ